MVVQTGAYGYLEYDFETTFNEAECVGMRNKVFGLEQRITGWTWTNSPIVLNQLNCNEVKTYAYGQARGSMSIDWVVSNPWYNSFVFSRSGCATFPAGCAAPFTYTWNAPSNACSRDVESLSIEVGIDQTAMCAADTVRVARGAIANSVALRSTIGEPVRATADISYTSDCRTTALEACPASETVGRCVCQFEPYTFAHGTLELPNCTVIAELQSFDITFNPNQELLYQHSSNKASSAFRRVMEITGTFNAPFVDYAQLDQVYAQIEDNAQCFARETPTMTIVLDNGGAAAAEREIRYVFTGVTLRDHAATVEPVEPIFETVSWQARSVVATAINGNAAEP